MFGSLFESKGVKRTLASVVAVATFASTLSPALTPYTGILIGLGGGAGVIGLAHPAVLKAIGFLKVFFGK